MNNGVDSSSENPIIYRLYCRHCWHEVSKTFHDVGLLQDSYTLQLILMEYPSYYRMYWNFGGGRHWQIWRMTVDLPSLFQPNFIQVKKVSRDKFICTIILEYVNVDFKILQLYTHDCTRPRIACSLSNFVSPKANELANTEVERWRTMEHEVLGQHHIWFWLPLRGLRCVKELQSMASHHTFVM